MRPILRYTLLLLAALPLLLLTAAGVVLAICLSGDSPDTTRNYPAQSARLRQHVEALCAAPRYVDSKQQAREYIVEQFRSAGFRHVHEKHFTTADGEQHCNISVTLYGSSDKRIVIGAHYDACDTGNGNPGADDNASAVAVLLELARNLPTVKPRYDVELVAWDCEEPPYFDTEDMGSAHHASSYKPEELHGVICLEMLGYFRKEPNSQPPLFPGHSLLLPTVGNFVAVVGDWNSLSLARAAYSALRRELPAVRLNIPFAHDTDLYLSDHRNYAPRDIPAIMITDTAMLRNPHYHEPTDTPDTLDYDSMARVTRGIHEFLIEILYK